MELNDRPLEKGDARNTLLVGWFGRNPTRSVRALLESLLNCNEWSHSIGTSLNELGFYFDFPSDWWKNRDGMGTWLLAPMAAAFADAWIYLQWLNVNKPELAHTYSYFFSRSVMHKEFPNALEAQWAHYPIIGGNMFETLPKPGQLRYPISLRNTPWYPDYKHKLGQELIRRSTQAEEWLRTLFTSPQGEKASKLEEGLSHITLAAIKGDSTFFTGLGKALSETFIPYDRLTLEETQNQPTSKTRGKITTRQWCRRLWISRGLWLIPPHLLRQAPLELAQTSVNELIGRQYRLGKARPQNDGLFLADLPWLNEWQPEKSTVSLSSEGKKHLPEFNETGFNWGIVAEDLK